MKSIKKVAGINLVVLLVYSLIIFVSFRKGNEGELAIMIFSSMLIGIQVTGNFLASLIFFIRKDKELGKAFILSSLIVLIVGFSACLASVS
jgi:hypothetical protein